MVVAAVSMGNAAIIEYFRLKAYQNVGILNYPF